MEKLIIKDSLLEKEGLNDQDLLFNLKKQPSIQQLINIYGLDDRALLDSYSMLDEYQESKAKCQGCLGLSYCRQSLKGCVMEIFQEEDGRLLDRYTSCTFSQEEEKKMTHKNYFKISDMSEQDYTIDFKGIEIQNESADYLNVYIALGRSLDNEQGMYIYGHTGVGKSYLVKAICNEYAKNKKSVCFCKVPLLMQNFYAVMSNQEELNELLEKLYHADVLVLDDIGSERMTKFIRDSLLFPVLDERLSNHKKTYFTSNYSLEDLKRRYSHIDSSDDGVAADRLIDRIRPMGPEILLKGQTRR